MGGPTDLRVIEPAAFREGPDPAEGDDADGERVDPSVHGVVLAAGPSSRYGDRNKLLASVDGAPIVRHATRTLLAADLDEVTVVVGYEADRVRAALAEESVAIVQNDRYAAGQSTSVAAGVRAASERGADAAIVALGDMPDVDVATIDLLVEAYAAEAGDAVAAAYEGQRGNPVLFDSRYFGALTEVDGDVGGRDVLLSDPDAVAVATGDPGVRYDVDRPADI